MGRQSINIVSPDVGHSHTTLVYGMAEYAKKDAPYKMGRKSERKAEAAKKAAPLIIPAVAKCIYGVTGE